MEPIRCDELKLRSFTNKPKTLELFKYYLDIQSLKVQLGIWESKLMTLLKCLKTSRFEMLNTSATYVADVSEADYHVGGQE
ncbi:MAG: hypothetical protein ACI9LX_003299 [Paraglaciecola sp.]|jgi:hypothetical protein